MHPINKAVYYVCMFLAFAASGCTLHSVQTDMQLSEALPAQFSLAGEDDRVDRWWTSFDDPILDSLIHAALAENLTLEAAWARLHQAQAAVRLRGSSFYPQIDANSAAARSRTQTPVGSATDNRFEAGLSLNYELDLWERIRSLQEAASYDAAASHALVEATALSLTANTAELWYTILEQSAQHALLEEQRAVSQSFLELVEARFGQGLASAVEVYQQREQVAATDSQVPEIKLLRAKAGHALALLLGKPALAGAHFTTQAVERVQAHKGDPLTALAAFPGEDIPHTGIPANVLLRRPDVRAAHARLVAADFRVAAAVAERMPAIRIGGSGATVAQSFADLFSDFLWSAAAQTALPLIDGGRRRAEVERTEAAVREAAAEFERVCLTAIQEVEDALAEEQFRLEQRQQLAQQAAFAEQAFVKARERYTAGLTPYLTVLTELRALQATQRRYLVTQKSLISARISLSQALGGEWMANLKETQQAEQPLHNKTMENEHVTTAQEAVSQ